MSHSTPLPGSGPPPGPGDRLRVTHHRPRPDVVVVSPVGEMDAADAPSVADRIRDLVPSCDLLMLDMRRVTFLDAGGVHALLEGTRAARRHATRLLVVGLDPASRRVLRICGVEPELTLTDVPDAQLLTGVALPCTDTVDRDRPVAGA